MQTHSNLRPLLDRKSSHLDIRKRKQRDELRSVFLQPAITHLGVAELALDHSKRILHLGTDALIP